MEKILKMTILAGLILLFLFGSKSKCYSQFDDEIVTEDRNVSSFEKVILQGGGTVHITQDSKIALEVKSNKDFIDNIKTSVSGNTLTISYKRSHRHNHKTDIYIRMPKLKQINLSGGGDVKITGNFDEDKMELSISGGGNISFKDENKVRKLNCNISGGGEINAFKLEAVSVDADMSGGGTIKLNAKDYLKAQISGGGDIIYDGDPKVNSHVNGGGSVKRR